MRYHWVYFEIKDVYYPDAGKVLRLLHGSDLLRGRVVDESDSGGEKERFVVVEVDGMPQALVVPMRCVKQELKES